MKKIVLAGGTGFIGSILAKHFIAKNYHVIILTRSHKQNQEHISYVKWDGKSRGAWEHVIENAEALINLNGKSVNCRYNHQNKQAIYDTRLDATNVLGEAIISSINPPKVWINTASATIYPHSETQPMTERHLSFDNDFSADVCKKWEAAFNQFQTPNVRKVLLRTAIVLGKNGGAFLPLKNLVKMGLGGKQGNGNQMVSWLHEADMAGIVDFCIQNTSISGTYNASAPAPVKNRQFMKTLRGACRTKISFKSPEFLLKIGAQLIGTEPEMVLKSRYVVPERLLNEGYNFHYTNIHDVFENLCSP